MIRLDYQHLYFSAHLNYCIPRTTYTHSELSFHYLIGVFWFFLTEKRFLMKLACWTASTEIPSATTLNRAFSSGNRSSPTSSLNCPLRAKITEFNRISICSFLWSGRWDSHCHFCYCFSKAQTLFSCFSFLRNSWRLMDGLRGNCNACQGSETPAPFIELAHSKQHWQRPAGLIFVYGLRLMVDMT